uniref:Uncharacterized protein n=1 Tax=Dicentrarchus labrax TaxID=13489 RepID=A0A8P4G5D6_DICLA
MLVLLEALGATEASLSRLPPQLRLPVAVTCYWLQRAQPHPDVSLLKALLLGISNGEGLRQRAGITLIQSEHCKQKLDVRVVHAFNQWQACLKDSLHLNQLLGFPLPEPQIARLYEGTLVHHLVHCMRTRKLKHLLKYNHSSMKQYKTMLAVIHQFRAREAPTPSKTQERSTARQRQSLYDLTVNLQQLYGVSDEEVATEVRSAVKALEDIHLEDLVLLRTRYKAKERNNRSKNPELARKEECRGVDLL